MNELYPIFLKVSELQVLIVGGGAVGLEKLTFLLKSSPSARVTLVAEEICEEIRNLSIGKQVLLRKESFDPSLLKGVHVVVAATNDLKVNLDIHRECRARNILVNVADNPPYCDFYMGGIVTKGNLKIAISTNGKSPTAAKRLRQFFEELLPDNVDELLENLNAYRKTLTGNFKEKVDRMNELTKELLSGRS